MAGTDKIDTLEKELTYQAYILKHEMKRSREASLRALRQLIEESEKLFKEISVNTTEDSIIGNGRLAVWAAQGARNLEESTAEWYKASQMLQEINFLKTLYEKEKVTKP